jgi:phosphatidylserine/phosphatidylglycerophosphate/cardiolipin synthase-like enzyme
MIMKRFLHMTVVIIIMSCAVTADESFWAVYFTKPYSGQKKASTNHPRTALITLIDNAQEEVLGAFYDLSSREIASSLIRAHERGVQVKLVLETDNIGRKTISRLVSSGVPMVGDQRSGLMHNKFCVIDRTTVWTGSYNLTYNGAFKNNNNAIAINSKELADIFRSEFIEMFKYRIFGNRKEFIPFPFFSQKYHVKIKNTNINAYFSPEDDIARIIRKRVKKAKKSIYFMAFSFTSDGIGEEMIRAHKRGVTVSGIFEKRGSGSRYSEYIKMKLEGIPVVVDKNLYSMHHKVIIIDGLRVILGSYNYSKNASKRNDENILIIDNAEIAAMYMSEFKILSR